MSNELSSFPEYEPLRPIMATHGATCTPREFYWQVNEAFHTVEAQSYDDIHSGMFAGSDPMWGRLLKCAPDGSWDVLDVGAGTGLVGEHLLRLAPGRVTSLVMLDPNDAMLERARERSETWPAFAGGIEFVQGDIAAVERRSFDLITVSSVFHHVVEIQDFSQRIKRLLRPGGVLLQMQDPRAGNDVDATLRERREAARAPVRASLYKRVRAAGGNVLRRLGLKQSGSAVANSTNDLLVEAGVIARPLDMATIWAVTDFHVPGQPGGVGQGIALSQLAEWLQLEQLDSFTYEFQGKAWDELTPDELAKEKAWWDGGDEHGAIFGSAWRKPCEG